MDETDGKKRKKRKFSQEFASSMSRVRSPTGSAGAGDVSIFTHFVLFLLHVPILDRHSLIHV